MKRSLALAVLATIGCSDASGPPNYFTPAVLAEHFDSLYVQACDGDYTIRCQMMSVLVEGTASGVQPSSLTVNNTAINSNWGGIVIDFVDTASDGAPRDSGYVLIAYSDFDATDIIIAHWGFEDPGAWIQVGDTIGGMGFGSFAVSPISRGGRCSDTEGLANPLVDSAGFPPIAYSPSICQLSTFAVQWSGEFQVLPADSGYGAVEIPSQVVNGITVFNSPWGFYSQRRSRTGRPVVQR